jgi:hypothetical protein
VSKANTAAIKAFNEALDQCVQPQDSGQSAVDLACVYKLVRASKEAAYQATELKCILAQQAPNYLRVPTIVAWFYKYAFNDDTLITMVKDAAASAVAHGVPGADRVIEFVDQTLAGLTAQAAASVDAVQPEPPARVAARKWWETSGKTEAICDNCNTPMQFGEGYSISGRQMKLPLVGGGEFVMELGDELICEACAKTLFSGE